MNPALVSPTRADERDVLSAALRRMRGSEAALEDWSAQPLTKHGKQRVVRYDLRARAAPGGDVCFLQWVGKFYEDDGAARRVAAVLLQLAGSDCGARGEMEVPRVLAYDAPRRLLLLTYETGDSVVSTIAHQRGPVLPAIGRALAALHGTPVSLEAITSPADVLDDLRPRVTELRARFPARAGALRYTLTRLEQEVPPASAAPSFLHGDFGTANLLWRPGRLVVLDFDRCTRGDPAADLGYLLTQLRRVTVRKPGKLPEFASLRNAILDAYRRWSPPDRALGRRVAWYERATLVSKIHVLAFDLTRHPEADARRQRQVEAVELLQCLASARDSDRSS
ncbi:MAG TPA: aminoglycoside phosphotransferase family protein [Gemmatimonadales bacterium]|nr:aminoglycoside phosphotransferase family protein [Gemmatimonadales bacterium]